MMKAHLSTLIIAAIVAGCGPGQKQARKDGDFFTSGNKEADQRADQRMAKTEELRGTGGAGGESKASANVKPGEHGGPPRADAVRSLFDRLGGQDGIAAIVDDFVNRAIADPRVNWERKGVTYGGLGIGRNKSVEWKADAPAVAQLKKHIVQFVALSTGGPAFYDGLEMKAAHANKHVTNAEFDATVGDLKATLDKLQVPAKEQKELLSIVESTRPQVVEER
jgi:hemoglobin